MKLLKMFGFAALAASMAMAFAGAGSAMAERTRLCQEDSEFCMSVTHGHLTTLAGQKAVLKTSLSTIECDVLFLGDTEEAGEPLVIKGSTTYTNCGTNCKVTEENGPAEIKVLKEGHETASVAAKGLVHTECTLNCRYSGVGLKGTLKGPLLSTETNGEATLTEQVTNKESGTFCPSTMKFTITALPLDLVFIR